MGLRPGLNMKSMGIGVAFFLLFEEGKSFLDFHKETGAFVKRGCEH